MGDDLPQARLPVAQCHAAVRIGGLQVGVVAGGLGPVVIRKLGPGERGVVVNVHGADIDSPGAAYGKGEALRRVGREMVGNCVGAAAIGHRIYQLRGRAASGFRFKTPYDAILEDVIELDAGWRLP